MHLSRYSFFEVPLWLRGNARKKSYSLIHLHVIDHLALLSNEACGRQKQRCKMIGKNQKEA